MATINGASGNDTIQGTRNADTINGNNGDDIIYGNWALNGRDILNGNAGNDKIYTGDIGNTTARGGIGNDIIVGAIGASQTLYGDEGNDTIDGGSGQDQLYGGAGNDIIRTGTDYGSGSVVSGGDGDDNIYSAGVITNLNGDAGNDTFHADQGLWKGSENYYGGTGFDIIIADSKNQNIGIKYLREIEKISGNGYTNVNIQTSIDSTNVINLTGIELVDINWIRGQSGNDTITLEGAIISFSDVALSRNDLVSGGAGNDRIRSGFGNDTIFGDAGDDSLDGGLGLDILTGGKGADSFEIADATQSLVGAADRITDFSTAESDKVNLIYIDANVDLENNQAFNFIGESEFTGVAGELRIEIGTDGYTHIYGTTNADTVADFEVIILSSVALTAASFVL